MNNDMGHVQHSDVPPTLSVRAAVAEPEPTAPFRVWVGPNGGFNVSGANLEYVCETGHGDMAMLLAYRIADLLNAHGARP